MFIEAARTEDIAPGGVISVKTGGRDLAICNHEGTFYAVERACGHAAARLERGTLNGRILTCPLHYAQFDITTGEALSGPIPEAPESKYADPEAPELRTRGLRTYPVKIENGAILVDIPAP